MLVGVNKEPLKESAIFAYDGSDYRVVKVDSDGNLVAAIKASQTIEVTQATAADLKATVTIPTGQDIITHNSIYWNSSWYKQPLQQGLSDVFRSQTYDGSTPSGTHDIVSATVPADTYWRMERLSFYLVSSTVTLLILFLYVSGTLYAVHTQSAYTSGLWINIDFLMTLETGEYFILRGYNYSVGDAVQLDVIGLVTSLEA